MTLLDTLNYFIEDQEGHLQCLEWDIREELNQEKPDIDWYCEEYDIAKQRVEDLQEIKLMIEEKDPVKQILNDPNDELIEKALKWSDRVLDGVALNEALPHG